MYQGLKGYFRDPGFDLNIVRTRENAKSVSRDTGFNRYSGCGIHQNIGTGCGIGKEYGIRQILDTSSRCRIVVKREQECGIRRTPLTDPDVCTCSVNSVLTVHMKKKKKKQ